MRFEGLNVAEFFSNIKDTLSKVTKAAGGNSDRESPNAANSTGLNSSPSLPELGPQATGERSEYVVSENSEDAEPPEESELASEYYSDSEDDEYPIVQRNWQGLRRLIIWLEIEPLIATLQAKGRELLQPRLSGRGTKSPQKSQRYNSRKLRKNRALPRTELEQINTELPENSALANTQLPINTELPENSSLPENSKPQENLKKLQSRRPRFWIVLGVVSVGGGALIYGLWICTP